MAGGISGDGTSESGILKPTDRRRACRLDRGKGTAICMPADVKWCECTWRKMDENWWWNIKHTINLSDNQIHTTRNKLIFLLLLGSPSNNPVDGGQVQIGDEILEECHHSVATRVDLGTPWFGSSGISQRRNHTTIKGCRIQFTIGLRYCWWKKSAPVLRLLGSFSPLFTRFYTSQVVSCFFCINSMLHLEWCSAVTKVRPLGAATGTHGPGIPELEKLDCHESAVEYFMRIKAF